MEFRPFHGGGWREIELHQEDQKQSQGSKQSPSCERSARLILFCVYWDAVVCACGAEGLFRFIAAVGGASRGIGDNPQHDKQFREFLVLA